MSSEIIIVIALTVLAVAFIIWVRLNDQKTERKQENEKGESKAQ